MGSMKMKLRRESALRDRVKTYRRLIGELVDGDAAVIVEGKRDREALQALGVPRERIFTMNGSPAAVAEKVSKAADRAFVLTDFDAAGEDILSRIVPALEGCSVKPDAGMRKRLGGILGLRFFEEIARKARELEEKFEESER